MVIDKDHILKLADLAKITISEEEVNSYISDINKILELISQIKNVNTDGVEPLASVIDVTLPLREDKITDGDCRNKILANGPEVEDGYFAVPKVIE